jgi:hypothetical protein
MPDPLTHKQTWGTLVRMCASYQLALETRAGMSSEEAEAKVKNDLRASMHEARTTPIIMGH